MLPPTTVGGFPAGGVSPLLSLDGTDRGSLAPSQTSRIQLPASLPSERFCYPPLSPLEAASVLMKALTPDGLTQTVRSLRLLRLAVPTFRPQPRDPPDGRFVSRLSADGCSRLRQYEQARHEIPPKQVRHPTDCRFTSGCSPPRLAATQLPSVTGLRHTMTGTCTPPTKRTHRRTGWPGHTRP